MNLLFVIHSYFPYEDANTNCLMPIINKLKDNNNIIILANAKEGFEQPCIENGVEIYRYKQRIDTKFLSRLIKNRKYNRGSLLLYSLFIRLMCICFLSMVYPYILFYRYVFKAEIYTDEYVCMKAIKKLILKKKVDSIITVSAPSYPHYAALSLAKANYFGERKTNWFAYFMDPDATYLFVSHKRRKEKVQKEKLIYQYASKVILPPEMHEENQTNEFKEFTNKMAKLNFANLKRIAHTNDYSIDLDKNYIECAYIGSLNDERIRDPGSLLNIIRNIDDRNFRFHFIGPVSERIKNELNKMQKRYGPQIVLHGKYNLDKCFYYMSNSDVLINLGNNCKNQLPSKIFDYISSGKPIVNFYSHKGDTSKVYLAKYPLCLNLLSKQDNLTLVQEFKDFCLRSKGKKLEYELIKKIYAQNVSENVVNSFEEIISFGKWVK